MEEYVKTALVRHIRKFPNFEWNWEELSMHPNLNQCVLEEFKDKPWNMYLLATHPNFNFGWVDVLHFYEWDWDTLSGRASMSDVLRYKDKPWDWTTLTLSNKIRDDDMMKYPDFPWDFNMLGYNNVEYNELRILRFFRNRFHNENWHDFTRHSSWDVIKANLDIPWRPFSIPFNSGDISTDEDIRVLEYFIERGSHLDWERISRAACISVVRKNLHLPWEWRCVSMIPSVTWETVSEYGDLPWDMNLVPLEDTASMVRRWWAAKTIQKRWKECVSDPSHAICMRRLRYEFNMMLS